MGRLPSPSWFDLGRYGRGHVLFGKGPELLVVVSVLLHGRDGALLAGLSVLSGCRETTLNHLLLEDIEDLPETVPFVFLAGREEEVVDGGIVKDELGLTGQVLADAIGLNGHLTLLVFGELSLDHGIALVDDTRDGCNHLFHNLAEFLEVVVDVADGERGELSVADHQAVGADAPVQAHHELEGVETVVAVLEDDADIGLSTAVRVGDGHVIVLESDHVEGTDALGTLLGPALLRFNRIPAELGEVVDDILGIGDSVLAGDTWIGGGTLGDIGAGFLNLVHGHAAHLFGEGNHCAHNIFLLSFLLRLYYYKNRAIRTLLR